MKKGWNTIFFGLCLMAALLGELYCLIVLKGELISTLGMGVVVLILSYLTINELLEQIRTAKTEAIAEVKEFFQESLDQRENDAKEFIRLQKASYAAVKKNDALFEGKLQGLNKILEELEYSHTERHQQLVELQEKALEGQIKIFNHERKDRIAKTQFLINALREEIGRIDNSKEFEAIRALLEDALRESKLQPFEMSEGNKEPVNITPLYDDPNKNLTLDEISSLFASYGR